MQNLITPIIDKPIRIALVGCGRVANNHILSINRLNEDYHLVALCDNNQSSIDRLKATYTGSNEVHSFLNYNELLQSKIADLIVLTTPSGLHANQAIAGMESGHHILTEKPMATMLNDARRMIKTSDAMGKHMFVVKQNRFNPTLKKAKEIIDSGKFGRIYMIQSNLFWHRDEAYYNSAKWRGTWEFDGGAFMNQASHYVDIVQWLGGPVASVHAYMGTLARKIESEDSGVLSMRFNHGGLGSLNVTMLTYPKNMEGSVTILGEKGTLRIGGVALNKIMHWDFEDKELSDEDYTRFNYEVNSVYGSGHSDYYRQMLSMIRGETRNAVTGRDGFKSLEVLAAAYLSAQKGKQMPLPLNFPIDFN